jgi:FtsZ-binding cell division protein ZapB
MSIKTLEKLETRVRQAAERLTALATERATLMERLEEMEASLKAQQAEIKRFEGAEGKAGELQQRQTEIQSEARRLQRERKTIGKRVEKILSRLDKFDLD